MSRREQDRREASLRTSLDVVRAVVHEDTLSGFAAYYLFEVLRYPWVGLPYAYVTTDDPSGDIVCETECVSAFD